MLSPLISSLSCWCCLVNCRILTSLSALSCCNWWTWLRRRATSSVSELTRSCELPSTMSDSAFSLRASSSCCCACFSRPSASSNLRFWLSLTRACSCCSEDNCSRSSLASFALCSTLSDSDMICMSRILMFSSKHMTFSLVDCSSSSKCEIRSSCSCRACVRLSVWSRSWLSCSLS
ncbi:hypothetical protein EDD16DRAFT_652074 [Pisolithus croceorrhizus]|nr:hypothetical protein EDD16DRAFT_652074 [Pisolithus croceorrhizus]